MPAKIGRSSPRYIASTAASPQKAAGSAVATQLAINDQPADPSARVVSSSISIAVTRSQSRPPNSVGTKHQNNSVSRNAATTLGEMVPAASVAADSLLINGAID